jgi:hypothetical protein
MPGKISHRGFRGISYCPDPPPNLKARKRNLKTKLDPSDYVPKSRDEFHDPVYSDRQEGTSVVER